MVVLPGDVAMFWRDWWPFGEGMQREPYDRIFASVTVIVVVTLGATQAQAEGERQIAHRLDTVTLLHICFLCHRVVVCI